MSCRTETLPSFSLVLRYYPMVTVESISPTNLAWDRCSGAIRNHALLRRVLPHACHPQHGFELEFQAVRALDCPWSDVTRLVLEVAPCR